MSRRKKSSYFWTSYSDLMTSLFFVMMVMFAVAIGQLQHKRAEAEKAKGEAEAAKMLAEAEINKIKEIENAIQSIDSSYFAYNSVLKKHILKIDVQFEKGVFDINRISEQKRDSLKEAGEVIRRFMMHERMNNPDVQYLLIIEGQSSRDNYYLDPYYNNDVLSFQRAFALRNFWEQSGINFSDECEVVVCGSGQNGKMRVQPDNAYNRANQRFLIHIMPKPGIIDNMNSLQ